MRFLPFALLAVAGCAGDATSRPRTYLHPESAGDARLNEALDAVPKDKVPPSLLDYAWKMPLVVPHTAAIFVRELPGAVAELAMTPVALVTCILEAVGLVKPERRPAPADPRERPR